MDRHSFASLRVLTTRFVCLVATLQLIATDVTACTPASNVKECAFPLSKRLASAGEFLDDSVSQTPAYDLVMAQNEVRRDVDPSTAASSVTASTTVVHSSVTASPSATNTQDSTSTASSSSSSAASSVAVVATTLPTPFDTSLGSNFTQSSCPAFFRSFLSNSTFTSCHPVSLLLQNSLGFFQATRSAPVLNATLDAACAASLAICSPLMSNLASDMIADSNCGADYKRQNPVVRQAYAGLIAYEPIYNATCLQDPLTGNYCYSEAIINSTNPSDSYPYYTALGISLPSGAQPSCSTCLQRTMNMFAGYAKLKEQPLASTYLGCASQVDNTCGTSFANTQVQVGSISSSDAALAAQSSWFLTSTAAVLLLWQVLT